MPSPLTLPVRYTRRQPPLGAPIRGGASARNIVSAHVANAGAGGTLFDSTRRWNGTLHGGVSWVASPRGRALKFDGSTGYVSTGLPYTTINANLAFSVAVRLRVDNVATLQTPVSVGDLALIVVGATDWRWQLDEGTFTNIVSAGPFASNTWYDFVLTWAGGTAGQAKIYVNGAHNDNGAALGGPVNGTLQLGNQQTGVSSPSRWSACQIEHVMVTSRVWAPGEVRGLAIAPFQIF